MKKALLVTRVSGFVPQFEMNNVKILQEMGYEVHYATDLNTVVYGHDNKRLEGTGIKLHQIDFVRSPLSKDVVKSYHQLVELMEKEKFNLIHCHMPMSGVIARKAAQKIYKETGRKVPVIYTAHGFHFFVGAPLKNWLYYPVERHMSRYTDRLITINDEDYKRAKKFPLRGRAEKINGVGINTDKFSNYLIEDWSGIQRKIHDSTEDIRKKYGIGEDYKILVSVGELAPGKNNMTVIEAMKELKDLKIAYLICGEGVMKENLQERVKELGLTDRVFFAGYVNNTANVLQQCDCFVFPSKREGLPVAMMEAMTVGLPVIASQIRGVKDLIEHTKGGYLINGFEPEDYAVKVRRMFTEKEGKSAVKRDERRRQMGLWNRERIKEFSVEVVDRQMRKIYDDVCYNEIKD